MTIARRRTPRDGTARTGLVAPVRDVAVEVSRWDRLKDPVGVLEGFARHASAFAADEIVVGARGLSRARALLGSVASELLHLADRPVVVIPTAAIEQGRVPEAGV